MDAEIKITAEPVDNQRCKFVVSQLVHPGLRRFASREEAAGSPLAEAIFDLPGLGVTELIVSGATVTVVKDNTTPWQTVGRPIGVAIREAMASPVPAVAARAPLGGPGDDALYERVAELFDSHVNPMVARHGGRVELIDVQDAVVMLRMGGGCQGCGMADVTLRQGIEGLLGQHIPEIRGVMDITDHGAGSNPYFQAAKQ